MDIGLENCWVVVSEFYRSRLFKLQPSQVISKQTIKYAGSDWNTGVRNTGVKSVTISSNQDK